MSGAEPGEPSGSARGTGFDELYEGTPPWEIGRPQRAVVDLVEAGVFAGSVLDVGCGTGEHALYLAEAGFDVLGVDASKRAVERARAKARERWPGDPGERSVDVEFRVFDALRLPLLGQRFDTVLDVGLFHVFDDRDRARYVEGLADVTRAGGRVHVLCFSDLEPVDWGGPRRVSEAELLEAFGRGDGEQESGGFRVDRVEPAIFETNIHEEGGGHAWLASFTRLRE